MNLFIQVLRNLENLYVQVYIHQAATGKDANDNTDPSRPFIFLANISDKTIAGKMS